MRGTRVPAWLSATVAGVAGAAAAGTLPNVLTGWLGNGRAVVTVVCFIAAGAFAAVNWWQQRRKGVGVIVSLPVTPWRQPWSRQWPRAATAHARKHHDSCLSVERPIETVSVGDPPEVKASKRERRRQALNVAKELVDARLLELATSDPSAPVSLYVNASLPDAFELGAALKFNVHRRMRAFAPVRFGAARPQATAATTTDDESTDARSSDGLPSDGPPSDASSLPQPQATWVQQRSEREDAEFYTAVRISSRLKDPPTDAERLRLADILTAPVVHDLGGGPEATGIALVVHLAHNPAMVSEAIAAAAAGCADAAGRWVRCRTAVVIEGVGPNVPEDDAVFELVLRQIYTEWSARSRDAGPRRLFLAVPVSIGFALGWLLGTNAAVVPFPYDTTPPANAQPPSSAAPPPTRSGRRTRVAGMPRPRTRR